MIINMIKGKQIEEQENNLEDGDVINNNNTNLIDFHLRVRAMLHGGMVPMGTILIGMAMMTVHCLWVKRVKKRQRRRRRRRRKVILREVNHPEP